MNRRLKIAFVTLGCSKNTVDSEVLAAQLARQGFLVRHTHPDEADVVIVNTCGFIGDAKQESVDTILYYLGQKKAGKVQKVLVMGCLSQRYPDELRVELPAIDGVFGVTDFRSVLQSLAAPSKKIHVEDRFLSTPSHYAYLKIAEGCDRRCSFCAIPMIRGPHTSRTMISLVREAENLASTGVKELNLIAQDTTSYGLDLYGKRMLAPLMERLLRLDVFEWIRLHYTFPSGFPDEVLDLMAAHPAICNYVDIPLQHISDRVLRSMKRGMYESGTRKLLDKIRSKVPGVAIRTAFIVGYPGETRQEFNQLLSFIQEQQFERAGVFTYSPEEGTAADSLRDNVAAATKQSRASALMEVQQDISASINRKRIGQTLKVLIDRSEGDYYIGRTEWDSPEVDNEVLIPASKKKLAPGKFYQVLIRDAEEFDLIGNVVAE